MEINHYGDTILGVYSMEDIIEGRMVCLDKHSFDVDFGSETDVPGARLPDSSDDAARARYCMTFAVDNRETPIYKTIPSFTFALRQGGWDQAANLPMDVTVFMTHPGNQEGRTVYSGWAGLAFGEGIYTVPSGAYVYSAAVELPGTQLAVAYTDADGASDAGKLKASTTNSVAEVVRFNTSNSRLTFKILH